MKTADNRSNWRLYLMAVLVLAVSWGLAGQSFLWLRHVAPGKSSWDFQIYLNAAAKAAQGQNPYLPFEIGSGFLNHPFVLSLVTPLAKLPPAWGTAVWMGAAFLAWTAAIGCAFLLAGRNHSITWRRTVFAAALFLGAAPLVEGLYVGQVSPFIALFLVLSLLLAETGRPVLAGVSLALAVVGKTSPLLLLVYFAVVGQWRVVGSALVTLLLVTLETAVQFSPDLLRQFLAFVPQLGAAHISPLNLSPLSLAARLLAHFGWGPIRFLQIVLPLLWLAAAVALARVGWRQRPLPKHQRVRFFEGFLLLMVFASPLVWLHHLLFLLLPLTTMIVSPERGKAAFGVTALLLIQGERFWETAVSIFPLPVVLAATLLLYGSISRFQKGERKL